MNIAIVGSSGGGAATLGHTDPVELLTCINRELSRIKAHRSHSKSPMPNKRFGNDNNQINGEAKILNQVKAALFISTDQSLDSVTDKDKCYAKLYCVDCKDNQLTNNMTSPFSVKMIQSGTLTEINKLYKKLDHELIAKSIENGEIDGLICISCDPSNINSKSISAAGKAKIPVTGSGGSSLACAVSMHGVRLVGNSGGSVATTTYTRAVSYIYSLCVDWDVMYNPFLPLSANDGNIDETLLPNVKSVLETCLPVFLVVSIILHALKKYGSQQIVT